MVYRLKVKPVMQRIRILYKAQICNETYETLFGHCSVLLVTAGQSVKQGQIIAQVGSTGYSTGPHLHYEVRQNGTRVNAMMFYK